jgi:hypothetical protein
MLQKGPNELGVLSSGLAPFILSDARRLAQSRQLRTHTGPGLPVAAQEFWDVVLSPGRCYVRENAVILSNRDRTRRGDPKEEHGLGLLRRSGFSAHP